MKQKLNLELSLTGIIVTSLQEPNKEIQQGLAYLDAYDKDGLLKPRGEVEFKVRYLIYSINRETNGLTISKKLIWSEYARMGKPKKLKMDGLANFSGLELTEAFES
jgi:hypothetical protein